MTLLVRMMTQGLTLSQHSRNLTQATLLAQQKMEEVYSGSETPSLKGDNSEEGKGEGIYSRFRWRREITPLSVQGGDLKELRVTIWWKEKKRERKLEFISYFAGEKIK